MLSIMREMSDVEILVHIDSHNVKEADGDEHGSFLLYNLREKNAHVCQRCQNAFMPWLLAEIRP